ncbi:hypothetical protein ASZ90_019814 [hydrocarbon metagenome]|uniref:Uncharacterized protein n=1 Tax=hydrocarbon metagenome TaxID=938273 RepID=A0A0W8E2G4_9ZZZZ
MIFFIVIAAFLAGGIIGIIPTVLIIKFYDKKPLNPYLPAFMVWLLGFFNYVYYKIISLLQDIGIDPIGQFFTLSIMAIAVISSCLSWVIADTWARKKDIVKTKLRRLVIGLNILTIVLPLLFMFIITIIWYVQK